MPAPIIYQTETCPYCGGTDIDYDYNGIYGDTMTWFFECENCGKRSMEVYDIQFKYTEGEDYA